VHGHWYGAPVDELRRAFHAGNDVLLKVDVQGAIQLRRRLPQAAYIFLAPPSEHDLICRLTARHTESGEDLARRIRDARFEMAQMPTYDYCVVNQDGDVRGAAEDVACIIRAEKLRVHRPPMTLN
jgi:guanylate kinase